MTNRNTILKLIVEAILIFGSVYGAFLLEAKRNIAFERDLLIGKLEKLIEDIDSDSIKLIGTYKELGDSIYTVNLYEQFKFDSIGLSLLEAQNSNMYDSIWLMFWIGDFFTHYDEGSWIESWDEEFSIYRQVLNSSNFFSNQNFYSTLKKYSWRRELLYNKWIEKHIRTAVINNYLEEKYNIFILPSKEVRKQIINEPIFQNTLWHETWGTQHIIEESKNILLLIPDVKTAIKEEIKAQKKLK